MRGSALLLLTMEDIIKKYATFVKYYRSEQGDYTDGIGMPLTGLSTFLPPAGQWGGSMEKRRLRSAPAAHTDAAMGFR